MRLVAEMLPRVNDVRREPIPASEIMLGTNCGGSDGNSGITANPALGAAADMLVAAGGTVILAETTELYGAEQLLTRRAKTPEIADKLLERIRWWEWYAATLGASIDNNPSPGNKAGGLTTIYEKSLGAAAKGGSTALVDVYQYAEQVTARGLVVMDTPGLDPVSVTGIVAGGANVIVFTTGRGSCFGCKPTPSIKVSSNTPLFERMRRRHGPRRRLNPRRPRDRGSRPRNLRRNSGRRQWQENEKRTARPRRRRIRAVDGRADFVIAGPGT